MPDGRLVQGAESRKAVLRRAVDVASSEGLDGLSFRRLAADLAMSKSGVQALFGSMEGLQIAAIKTARGAFDRAVVGPASDEAAGVARVRALVEAWLEYATGPLFSGGCFWAANLPVFGSRPGPVRDLLVAQQREWRGVLAAALRDAAPDLDPDLDPDLAAFQIDAVLTATNTALRLGDAGAADTARRAVDRVIS